MKTTWALVLLCLGTLPAQRTLFQHHGPPGSRLGEVVRPAGDVDGDGVTDFVATRPAEGTLARVEVVSGRLGTVIWLLDGFDMGPVHGLLDAVGLGDVDGDQRSDIAVATYNALTVHSGRTGRILHSRPGGSVGVSEVGDVDGDSKADCALVRYANGNNEVLLLDGESGILLGSVPNLRNPHADSVPRSVGDLTGDGRHELAVGAENDLIYVVQTSPPRVLRTLTSPLTGAFGNYFDTADLDGDGRREILVSRLGMYNPSGNRGRVEIYDAASGTLRLVIEIPYRWGSLRRGVTGVGDLDRDGVGDLVVESNGSIYGEVIAFSGRTGAVLWTMVGDPTFESFGATIASLGDVDADGYGDVAVGCPSPFPIAGGWKIVSGRILAEATAVGSACGGGPFLPQLGMTRPVLGQNATVACRDGAPGTTGILALSLAPEWPTHLGASTCTAWFDFDSWVALHTTTQAQWSLPVPIPGVPQLAGIEVALQCFYAPTRGPLGFDLSNGVHARIGF